MEGQLYEQLRAEVVRVAAQRERQAAFRLGALTIMRAKLGTVSSEDEADIEAIYNEKALIELIGVLGCATSAAEIRAALAAARTPR